MNKKSLSESKLRFLFVSTDKFVPFRVDVAVLFGQELVRRGHVIDWILQSEKACHKQYETIWSGCRVWVGATDTGTSRFCRIKKHIHDISNDFRMFCLASKNRYHFIQVKDKFLSALMAILAARLNRTRFIYWLSYPFPEASLYRVREGIARYPWFYWFRGIIFKFLLYRVIMPRADHVFVQSEQMKKDVAAMGISKKKLTAVPMGVCLEGIPYEPNKGPFMQNKTERMVVYLGTLARVRRIDFLIRVFVKVLRKVPNAKLYLVGGSPDPNDEKMLKDEALNQGVEGTIIFTEFLPMKEAWRFVRRADVCVSPIHPNPILNPGSPTKLIEYMAMGKAVVANDHPEQRLVISESGGGICVPYEEAAFANAIAQLLTDDLMAAEMGRKGRLYIEQKRTYKTIADLVEAKYDLVK